jgi:hypothetical protein
MGRKSTRAWRNRRESTMQQMRLDILERRLLVVPWASKLADDRSSPVHLYRAATSPPEFLLEKKTEQDTAPRMFHVSVSV